MAQKKTKLKARSFRKPKLIIAAVSVALVVSIGLALMDSGVTSISLPTASKPKAEKTAPTTSSTQNITWTQTGDGYTPNGIPPYCPDKIVQQFPADATQVTSLLYPGKLRGDTYRTDGTLRFDKTIANSVTVKAPFDGKIIGGAAYLAATSEVQYTFDVMHDCGMMYRIGGLLTLSPKLAALAAAFPPPAKGTPSMTPIDNVPLKAGAVIAEAVGTANDHNVSFDWGVYDWRAPNAISSEQSWQKDARHNAPLAKHGVCWLDQMPTVNATATIKGLPSPDAANSAFSDYCK